ncbi:MAG: alkaline phosphatase [Planctomycetota bacterium]|nr:alkaline phosphatase [Planctomycetota bacterium]
MVAGVLAGVASASLLAVRFWPVNHPPSFATGPDVIVIQDSGQYGPGRYPHCVATDSAAAATALACGRKTNDGRVAWLPGDPPRGAMETIAEHVRARYGFAMGVVTTVPFDHATPACFVSHNVSRNKYCEIGDEMINTVKPEAVIGSGHPAWANTYAFLGPTASATDDRNYRRLKDGRAGYTFVERVAGVDGSAALTAAAASATRLFGLFGGGGDFDAPVPTGDGSGSFTVTAKAAENPSLAAAATAALTVLSKNPNGFFLMVEGGDIDHANHANNFVLLLGTMHQFSEAVKSGEALVDSGSGGMSWNDTLFILTADHGNSFMRLKRPLGRGVLPPAKANGTPTDGSVVYGGRWGYDSTTMGPHTNELVSLYAKGAGAALFEEYMGTRPKSWYRAADTRIVDNTQVCEVMKRAAAEAGAKHIVLWIGDGMQKASEVAYANYRYGSFSSLPWAAWPVTGSCTTWSVSTYNTFASQAKAARFKEPTFLANPADLAHFGYDTTLGGTRPYPDDRPAPSDPDSVTQIEYFLGGRPPWALAITANDPRQTVKFLVSNDSPALFSEQPTINARGSLTFTPAPGASGSATVTIIAKDDGGTTFGGSDTSAPETFTITVNAQAGGQEDVWDNGDD